MYVFGGGGQKGLNRNKNVLIKWPFCLWLSECPKQCILFSLRTRAQRHINESFRIRFRNNLIRFEKKKLYLYKRN